VLKSSVTPLANLIFFRDRDDFIKSFSDFLSFFNQQTSTIYKMSDDEDDLYGGLEDDLADDLVYSTSYNIQYGGLDKDINPKTPFLLPNAAAVKTPVQQQQQVKREPSPVYARPPPPPPISGYVLQSFSFIHLCL
jgi:hypothetical protein